MLIALIILVASFLGAYVMAVLDGIFTEKFGKFVGVVLPGAIAFSLVGPIGVYLIKLVE